MFYKRWSNSVALPMGPQWGDPDNGKGGVAACMIWSRKNDVTKRPASAHVLSQRPASASNSKLKPSLKITGKAFSVRGEKAEPSTLNEQEVFDAVHQVAKRSVKRPATAHAAYSRSYRPINPTPPPTLKKTVKNNTRQAPTPDDITGWTYKYKEKNIYDLYDVDGFHSPDTPSRPGSAVYVPGPGLPEHPSRAYADINPRQIANETEFIVKTNGSHLSKNAYLNGVSTNYKQDGYMNNRIPVPPSSRSPVAKVNKKENSVNDEKYDKLSKELDRAIQTIRDLTKFQKETLGMYRSSHPAFVTTYDRDFNYRPSNAVITDNYKPQPVPPPPEMRGKRDFVKENARPIVKPRQAWASSRSDAYNYDRAKNYDYDRPQLHTINGPNGLMTIRVDCGEKPVKNLTVRVLNDQNGPKVTLDS